jgi:GT2 family glycosyltransferase
MSAPQVTIVVVPRERFSNTRQSLESIYQDSDLPFSLVYVDGNSPLEVKEYLEEEAQVKGFKLIRTNRYLAPNQARNIGLAHVNTKYVLFIDNDVVTSKNWLSQLINCAEETNAEVICPLTCIGTPLHQTIHLAGGEARIVVETDGNETLRKVHEKHYFVNRPVADVKERLVRQECEFAEFHCMLVRRDIFDRLGWLDEKLLSTREHTDFCLNLTQAGGRIYCEPNSVVTYVTGKLVLSDLAFFFLRWSDEWELSSLAHFQQKWNLTIRDKYFKKRYKRLGYRRDIAFLKPLVKQISFGYHFPWLEEQLKPLERILNNYISSRYRHKNKHEQTKIDNRQSGKNQPTFS